jgi:hypothetical protein
VLQRFERRIEELVNRPFARAFKAEVEPVEIASALQRECDDRAAIVSRGRTMVPNSFDVVLGERDYDRLSVYAEPLGAELAAMVREHAQAQGYTFLGPVTVSFERDPALETGRFRVSSAAVAGAVGTGRDRRRGEAGAPWLELATSSYVLSGATTRIGRGAENHLRIEDPGISRNHAELHYEGGDVTLVDLGSTNGVLVNGRRVERARLDDGAELVLGSTTMTFHAGTR